MIITKNNTKSCVKNRIKKLTSRLYHSLRLILKDIHHFNQVEVTP